ncbi:unnamed protein product [Lepeophtheirus salmonis]|uniref:(salmon louse) hypothetical protein n=1 Tax=Lepeophtheirus salmonis TaxID=72036 RepID=A0A7R8CB60_LEPSM|nr:unnamed protein product [Lepeophtheirus salmonis]CAF2757526.1 unnamed protein product [Lepeophtheirus salmonis]
MEHLVLTTVLTHQTLCESILSAAATFLLLLQVPVVLSIVVLDKEVPYPSTGYHSSETSPRHSLPAAISKSSGNVAHRSCKCSFRTYFLFLSVLAARVSPGKFYMNRRFVPVTGTGRTTPELLPSFWSKYSTAFYPRSLLMSGDRIHVLTPVFQTKGIDKILFQRDHPPMLPVCRPSRKFYRPTRWEKARSIESNLVGDP